MAVLDGKEKSSVASAVCSEIVSSISTLVMVHTMYPTPDEYTIISGFVSITNNLRCYNI